MNGKGKKAAWLVSPPACFVLALSLAPAASGQGTTGTITGTVKDPTGAIVPGVTVKVANKATNTVRTVVTSDAGTFTVTSLQPGQYSVTFDKTGFKTDEVANVKLTIDTSVEVDDTLKTGDVQQTVEVTSDIPVLQTDNSSVGEVIDSQAIQNVPLNGRLGINGLVALAPGIQGAGAQDQLDTRGVTAAVGSGARNSYGGLGSTLDGVTNQEVTLQRGEGEVPSLDAIAEFKVLTNGAPAEFNQPSQIVVVSASGTNKLHGEGFEFNRSKGTGAKAYSFSATPPARPPYKRNEYGGNLSGPIFIPHVYNGKDKSFFFAAFEGFKLTQSYTDSTTQPNLKERKGDFSDFLAGGVCEPIVNVTMNGVTTPTPTPLVLVNPYTGQPFPNNVINIPLNPVSTQLQTLLYPLPDVGSTGCGTNTHEQVAETSNATRFSLRLDHQLTQNDTLRFTYLRAFYGPSPTNGTDSLQGGNSLDGEHNQNYIVGWTHIFTPTLVLDMDASYFHLPIYRTPQNVNTNFSSIIPGLGPELIEGAPTISITNITSVGESGSHDLEQDAQINTTVSKILAKHTVKAGFSYLFNDHWNDSANGPQRGSYAFTSGNFSKIAYADFLLGLPASTGNATPNNTIVRHLSSQYGMFVQDDWKLTPKLTINAGLRYDLQWFQGNPYGTESLYIPALKEVVVFGTKYPAAALPQFTNGSIPINLSTNVGLPNSVYGYLGQAKKNFAPRFGFADEFLPKTVLRGAFGLYFNLLPSNYQDTAPFVNLPFVGSETFNNSTNANTAFTLSNPFPTGGASFTANPNVQTQGKTTTPYTEEYNLDLEHQFRFGFDVRIGYVGQHNLKQNNFGGPGNTSPNLNLTPFPVLTTGSAQSQYAVQPFASISQYMAPLYHSNENSLQIGVHKQFSKGLAFGAEYQWTRVLGTENIQNPSGATPNDSYGPVSGITPQVLALNYSYVLPFGRGQALFSGVGSFVDKVISGWQISGITSAQTGQPFSVTYSVPSTYVDKNVTPNATYHGLAVGSGVRADRVPGVPLYPANKTLGNWFNTKAFQIPSQTVTLPGDPTPQTIPGAIYGNSAYDLLRGPAFQDWDMNLQKTVAFKDRYKVLLRADSFNVFNHPNFGTPVASITAGGFGSISSTAGTPSYEQRTVEFGAKFNF
jgi:hypothetical protein